MLNLIPVLRSALVLIRHRRAAFAAIRFGKLYPATLVAALLFCSAPRLSADVFTIDFEGLNDGTLLTAQYTGLNFTNAIISTAGQSLNEFELPPHSGFNVVFDDSGPITIDFANPITSFSAFFTYVEPLTLSAFDPSHTDVASAGSLYSSNDAIFGDAGSSPNEFIQVSYAGGISRVTIAGDPAGGSFAMDDVTYSTTPIVTGVPEVSSLLLLFSALGVMFAVWAFRAKVNSREIQKAFQRL